MSILFRSNHIWVQTHVVIINAVLRSYACCVKFKCMLCLLSNTCCLSSKPCCVLVQIHVDWVQIYAVFVSSSYCAWIQIHLVFEFKVMLCVNAILCCVWVQILYYSVNVCDSTPCKNGGTCSISGRSYTCSCRDGYSGNQCQGTFNIYFIMCFECQ